jgi:hypothetical protein
MRRAFGRGTTQISSQEGREVTRESPHAHQIRHGPQSDSRQAANAEGAPSIAWPRCSVTHREE